MLAFLRPGFWEIAVIALVVVLLFGAKRLPDLARTVGRAVRTLRRSIQGEES